MSIVEQIVLLGRSEHRVRLTASSLSWKRVIFQQNQSLTVGKNRSIDSFEGSVDDPLADLLENGRLVRLFVEYLVELVQLVV